MVLSYTVQDSQTKIIDIYYVFNSYSNCINKKVCNIYKVAQYLLSLVVSVTRRERSGKNIHAKNCFSFLCL